MAASQQDDTSTFKNDTAAGALKRGNNIHSGDIITGAQKVKNGKPPAPVPANSSGNQSNQGADTTRLIDQQPEAVMADSETAVTNSQPVSGPGIFKGHSLRVLHPVAKPVVTQVEDWVTITLIVLLALLTWFNFFYHRIFRQLFSAYFNLGLTGQIVRDESVLLQRATLILSIISYALIGLFFHLLCLRQGWDIPLLQTGILRFALLSVLVAMAYSLKMLLLRFLSEIFGLERSVALYVFNIFLMVMMSGLVLFPVNIIMAYASREIADAAAVTGVITLAVFFVYRLIRAAGIWTGIPRFSVFYLFLYLCSFEIAPLLILWKVTTLL